jgi:uncharacterized protein (DUF983 family)
MNDATCPKCGKRFGWVGELTDKPPCPRCGHEDDPEELDRVQKLLDETEARMMKEFDNDS